MCRLQLPRRETVRAVQTHVLLLLLLPKTILEETQEDVHGADCDTPPASEAELRVLHKGMHFLNRCIQENGAGDGPTSDVLKFLLPCPE